MASILRARKNELTADEIAAVKLSNRQEYGEYVTYTALSSDGVTTYTVTLNAQGNAVGCTCPSVVPCKHRAAAEFEEAWSSPVCGELEAEAEKIIAEEKARKEAQAKAEKQDAKELVVLRDGEGLYYVMQSNAYRVMSAHDLRNIGPYREGNRQDCERLKAMLEAEYTVREAERIVSEERRKKAPLNGDGAFSLYR